MSFLSITAYVLAWGAWAACGYMGWAALPLDRKSVHRGKVVMMFSVLFSPLVSTFLVFRYALYWF